MGVEKAKVTRSCDFRGLICGRTASREQYLSTFIDTLSDVRRRDTALNCGLRKSTMTLEHVVVFTGRGCLRLPSRTPPPSLWLTFPRKPPRKSAEVRKRINAASVRTAILGGTWRGRDEHQKVVFFVVPVGGAGHERWVGAEVLLMTCFPSLLLTLLP